MEEPTQEELEDFVRKFKTQLDATLANSQDMIKVLGQDCIDLLELDRKEDKQLHRRSYIRAVFAFIESTLWNMKQTAFWIGMHLNKLSIIEQMALIETNFDLSDNGTVKEKFMHTRLEPNVKFAFYAMAKCSDSDFKLDTGKKGWENFKASVKVRDRLTHPKTIQDLEVSNEEMTSALLTFNWFSTNHLLSSTHAAKSFSEKGSVTGSPEVEAAHREIARLTKELEKYN